MENQSYMKGFKLSIITITYNNLSELKKTVNSVIRQITSDVEYLIIDGKSTDGTSEYLENISEKMQITYISEKDNGIYYAMNKGIKMSTAEWIYFLNAGDLLINNAVNCILKKLADNVDALYGSVILTMNYNGKSYGKIDKADTDLSHLKRGMICSHQGFVCKKNVIEKCGGFDTSFKIAGDWNLISKIYSSGYKLKCIDCILAIYDQSGASIHPHLLERHRVRKNHQFYHFIDFWMIKDFFHDIKSILLSKILGKRKRKLAIKLKGYKESILLYENNLNKENGIKQFSKKLCDKNF